MPIEVKELIIRATIDAQSQSQPASSQSGRASGEQGGSKMKEYLASLVKHLQNDNER